MTEERISGLQSTFAGEDAAIAILPANAIGRLAGCGLPTIR